MLLRRSFTTASEGEHLLHVTAQGVPNRMPGAGANATKLLCSYKLWVNGVSVSAGPGRPTGANSTIQSPALLYDTVNVTSLLRFGGKQENVIAVEAFYWNEAQEKAEVSVLRCSVQVAPHTMVTGFHGVSTAPSSCHGPRDRSSCRCGGPCMSGRSPTPATEAACSCCCARPRLLAPSSA